MVVDWAQLECRQVITGPAGSGKSAYADRLRAQSPPFSVCNSPNQVATMAFVRVLARADEASPAAIVCENVRKAYNIAKQVRGRLVHCWAR